MSDWQRFAARAFGTAPRCEFSKRSVDAEPGSRVRCHCGRSLKVTVIGTLPKHARPSVEELRRRHAASSRGFARVLAAATAGESPKTAAGESPKKRRDARARRVSRALSPLKALEVRHGRWRGHAVTYQREHVLCGKPKCRELHGPYWYAYWKHDGRTRKRYVGKAFRELGDEKP